MKISVIGAGNVGAGLAATLTNAANEVLIADHDPQEAARVAGEAGCVAAESNRQAAETCEALILAVPFAALEGVAEEIKDAVSGKVVIDATNPLKPDYSGLVTSDGPSGAERVREMLPGAKVVKAFNTMFASNQGEPLALGEVLDAFFATDDDDARSLMFALLAGAGYRPVDVGPLARARELEAMAFLNIALQMQDNGHWQSAWKLVQPPSDAVRTAPTAA